MPTVLPANKARRLSTHQARGADGMGDSHGVGAGGERENQQILFQSEDAKEGLAAYVERGRGFQGEIVPGARLVSSAAGETPADSRRDLRRYDADLRLTRKRMLAAKVKIEPGQLLIDDNGWMGRRNSTPSIRPRRGVNADRGCFVRDVDRAVPRRGALWRIVTARGEVIGQ